MKKKTKAKKKQNIMTKNIESAQEFLNEKKKIIIDMIKNKDR